MSLQGKWLPPERGVDFYIEMLKTLGSRPSPGRGIPPPWAAPKNPQNPHRFLNDVGSQNDSKNAPKIITKPSWNPDRIRTPFFSLSGTPN